MDNREIYKNELWGIAAAVTVFANMPEDRLLEMPIKDFEKEAYRIEAQLSRAEEVCQILGAIDHAIESVQHEHARLNLTYVDAPAPSAEKSAAYYSTQELLTDVSRHLSGKDVDVKIENPRRADFMGLCIWNPPDSGHAIKIQISPAVTWDANKYLEVFLHEVSHAKLHGEYQDINNPKFGTKAEAFEGQHEMEAGRLGNRWKHYADTHHGKYHNNGGVNEVADLLRAKLLALLFDDDIPAWSH